MGMGTRKVITLNGTRVEFGTGCSVRVVFKPNEIQVGCHSVSLDAWRELVKNYDAYLVGKSEQVYQEG